MDQKGNMVRNVAARINVESFKGNTNDQWGYVRRSWWKEEIVNDKKEAQRSIAWDAPGYLSSNKNKQNYEKEEANKFTGHVLQESWWDGGMQRQNNLTQFSKLDGWAEDSRSHTMHGNQRKEERRSGRQSCSNSLKFQIPPFINPSLTAVKYNSEFSVKSWRSGNPIEGQGHEALKDHDLETVSCLWEYLTGFDLFFLRWNMRQSESQKNGLRYKTASHTW